MALSASEYVKKKISQKQHVWKAVGQIRNFRFRFGCVSS